jgi:hypothetical protein
MQRLTWGGVALHAGSLPGRPASHGCIRLPHEFARLLYGVTRVGMTVVVTERAAVPRIAPAEALLAGAAGPPTATSQPTWQPERSPSGPVSIVVSAADRRAVVLRNGIVIGTSPATIEGALSRTLAFMLTGSGDGARSWLRIALPGQAGDDRGESLRGRIAVPETFRAAVEAIIAPGTTVVVTNDPLREGGGDRGQVVLEQEPPAR